MWTIQWYILRTYMHTYVTHTMNPDLVITVVYYVLRIQNLY